MVAGRAVQPAARVDGDHLDGVARPVVQVEVEDDVDVGLPLEEGDERRRVEVTAPADGHGAGRVQHPLEGAR